MLTIARAFRIRSGGGHHDQGDSASDQDRRQERCSHLHRVLLLVGFVSGFSGLEAQLYGPFESAKP